MSNIEYNKWFGFKWVVEPTNILKSYMLIPELDLALNDFNVIKIKSKSFSDQSGEWESFEIDDDFQVGIDE